MVVLGGGAFSYERGTPVGSMDDPVMGYPRNSVVVRSEVGAGSPFCPVKQLVMSRAPPDHGKAHGPRGGLILHSILTQHET